MNRNFFPTMMCVLYVITIRMFLLELEYTQQSATEIFTDSQPSLDILKNEQITDKVLYINVRIHFIREYQLLQQVISKKVDTTKNLSDTMTKALPNEAFHRHKQRILYGHLEFAQELKDKIYKTIIFVEPEVEAER